MFARLLNVGSTGRRSVLRCRGTPTWQTLEPRLKQYQALIAEDVKADTRKLYSFEAFQSGLTGSERSLQSFVERRREFLLNVTAAKSEMK